MSCVSNWNDSPYLLACHCSREHLFDCAKSHCTESPIKGRVRLICVVLFDLTTDLLVVPVHMIYNVALATLGLVTIPFVQRKRESFQNVIYNTLIALGDVLYVPFKGIRLPFMIANQFFVIIASPNRAKPAHNLQRDIVHVFQENIYWVLNNFSRQHSIAGRLFSIPVSLIDVSIELLESPVRLVDYIINAILSAMQGKFRETLDCTEKALKEVWSVPVTVLMAPVKFAFQTCAILYDPAGVSSINKHFMAS